MTHPRVWHRVSEDGIEPHQYRPLAHPRVFYLRGDEDKLCSFMPRNGVMWEQHIACLPAAAGIDDFAHQCVRWMFERGAHKIVAMPPSHNWHAAALARRIGFKDEGRIERAFMWQGRLRDLIVLGVNKWQT